MRVAFLLNKVYCFQPAVMVGALRHLNTSHYRVVAGPSRSALTHRPQQQQRTGSNPGIIEEKTNEGLKAFFGQCLKGRAPGDPCLRVYRQDSINELENICCVDCVWHYPLSYS